MRHLSSPRIPCAARTWATTSSSSDDVEIDSGAFSGRGGFDERSETADDAALAADDFADVFFVDFELVDSRVAILDFVDFDGVGFVDEGSGNVFDQAFQIRFELFEVFIVLEFTVIIGDHGVDGWLFRHGCFVQASAAAGVAGEVWGGGGTMPRELNRRATRSVG
jgi:hypothetical protein